MKEKMLTRLERDRIKVPRTYARGASAAAPGREGRGHQSTRDAAGFLDRSAGG